MGRTPLRLDDDALRSRPLPQPGHDGDKETRGRVLVIAGSREIPGAALLAGTAALRAGAGKLVLATSASMATPLAIAMPEARVLALPELARGGLHGDAAEQLLPVAAGVDAVVIGPGMMDENACIDLVQRLMPALGHCTVVLDAYAMSAVLASELRTPGLVITPHAGEMAHLSGLAKDDIAADPSAVAEQGAALWNACVVLKGALTVVTRPGEPTWHHHEGRVGLATSGSGDTLAGLIGGLAARGAAPLDAALWGVRLHALAGERLASRYGTLGYLARELPAEIPPTMQALCT